MNAASKLIFGSCLAGLFCLATQAIAQAQLPAATTPAPAPVRAGAEKPTAGKILTEDQIAAMLTEWTDEKSKEKMQFTAAFGARSVSPEEKIKYAKSGKIPVFIACQLDEIKDIQGKKLAKRMGGTANFYILDSDGKVIVNKAVPLDKMCPS